MLSVRDLETNDPTILLKRISQEFPELRWEKYEFVNRGWDHEVIILDNRLVFRFPASSEYLAGLEKEVSLLNYLNNKIDFPIPRYIYVAHDKTFAGYEIIPGKELDEYAFTMLPDRDQGLVAEQLADFFTRLHSINIEELQPFDITLSDLQVEAQKLQEGAEQYLQHTLTRDEYVQASAALHRFQTISSSEYPRALIHNDISPKHIIWDNEARRIGVIDFGDRAISDPAIDFAELFLYDQAFAEKVYRFYAGLKDDTFLNRSIIYAKRVGIHTLVNSFLTDKMSHEAAKAVFDKTMRL